MSGLRRALSLLVLCIGLAMPSARAAEPADLLLVLAADVSRSVTDDKFDLQRKGYAAAVTDKSVLEAITAGRTHRIAVLYMEWAGAENQQVVIDWTLIDGAKAAQAFAGRLLEAPRSFAGRTSISGGINFALAQLSRAPYAAERRTIDVSGDGTNNSGGLVESARDRAVKQDVTVNGLVILSAESMSWNPLHTNPPGGLAAYYRTHVIGGPGSFVMVAKDFHSFGEAIIKKLIAEIAGVAPGPRAAANSWVQSGQP